MIEIDTRLAEIGDLLPVTSGPAGGTDAAVESGAQDVVCRTRQQHTRLVSQRFQLPWMSSAMVSMVRMHDSIITAYGGVWRPGREQRRTLPDVTAGR